MKIDVIMCVYNGHKYIKKALDSIVNQTIIDRIEITIVDDGSTYGYDDIINNYDKKINIITLKKNKGLGYARQVALNNTKNEYIMFIDCDDEFYDNQSVEKLYNNIEKDQTIDVVEGNIIIYNKLIENPLLYVPCKIYRRSFLNKNDIKFLPLRVGEDTAFTLAISVSGANVKRIDDIIYKAHYINKNSITHSNNRVSLTKAVITSVDYAYTKIKDYDAFIHNITNIYEIFITLFIKKNDLKREEDLINYARICKKFYKKYKKYIIETDYIKMHKNIFDTF